MPKRTDIRKIMVIGSGPIVIGQAAEFDYSGTQACLSLKEEGYQVVLVNSNPATIMTDKDIADKVYIEPITLEFVTRILRKERPDALLPTLGGQTGLNMAMALSKNGILEELNVELLGTKLSAIDKAEDRDLFKQLMEELNQPIPESEIVNSVEEAIQFAEQIGYPLIVRPAFTLGGTGGGMCDNQEQLVDITTKGLKLSPVTQCLIERSIAGFKEIEYEVMRDAAVKTGGHVAIGIGAAKAGAIIGSAFPVVGTAGGAVVGFAIGIAGSMAFDWLYDNKEQVYNTTKKVISTRKTIDSVVYEGFWR